MLASCLLNFIKADAIVSHLESCYVFQLKHHKNVIRKFLKKLKEIADRTFSSFDGATFKTEASSKFPHNSVRALGSYRNSPFVTGHDSSTNGLTTEILDYEQGEWEQESDYPFSNNNRYDCE